MTKTRIVIFTSWLLTSLVIGGAIFSTSYMRGILRGEMVESASETILVFLLIAAMCGWPWHAASKLPASKENIKHQYLFSSVALFISCVFFIPITTGIDFEIGFYTILCVLCIWAAYPISRLIGSI